MALVDRTLRLRLVRGLETEADDRLVPAGGLTRLEDGLVTPASALVKRPGNTLIDRDDVITGNPVSGALAVWSDGDTLYRHAGGELLYSHGPGDGWRLFGHMRSPTVTLERLVRGPRERWNGDCVATGGMIYCVWEEYAPTRQIHIAAVRESDGAVVLGPTGIGSNGTRARSPRAAMCGPLVHFYFIETGDPTNGIYVKVVNPSDPYSTWGDAAVIVTTDVSNRVTSAPSYGDSPGFDVAAHQGAVILVHQAASEDVKASFVSPAGQIVNTGSMTFTRPNPVTCSLGRLGCGPTIAISSHGYAHVFGWCVSGNLSSGQYPGLAWAGLDAGSLTGLRTGSQSGGSNALDTSVPSGSGYVVTRMAAGCKVHPEAAYAGTDPLAYCFYEVATGSTDPSVPSPNYVKAVSMDYSRTVANAQIFDEGAVVVARRAYLAGRPIGVDQSIYCPVVSSASVQQNSMLVDQRGYPFVRITGLGSRIYSGSVPSWATLSDGRVATVVAVRDEVPLSVSADGTATSTGFAGRGLGLLTLDLTATSSLTAATRGGYTLVGGGQVHLLDGSSCTELGFHSYPEGVVALPMSSSISGVGRLTSMSVDRTKAFPTGTYVYRAVYEWPDAYGRIHRSAGETYTVTLSGTANYYDVQNSVYHLIPTLQATLKGRTVLSSSMNGPVRVALFRTGLGGTAAGTVRQRVDSPTEPIVISPTASYHGYLDTLDDDTLATREVDVSDVNVPPLAPPACRSVSLVKGRFMLAGVADAPRDVWYSLLGSEDEGPAFSPTRVITVPEGGDVGHGPITAVSQLDSNGIVLTDRAILAFAGDGPSDLIADNTTFTDPTAVSSDVGCDDARSVTPVAGDAAQGLMLRSRKGWRLLDRGLTVRDIGAPVREFDGLRVAGADRDPSTNLVRIVHEDGPSLVFDSRWGQWSSMRDMRGAGSTVHRGRYHALRSDGYVVTPTTGTAQSDYRDGNRPYPMLMETGWITHGGLQDRGRLRDIRLLGRFHSHHILRVEVAYDYRDDYAEVHDIDTRQALVLQGYGTGSYGIITPTQATLALNNRVPVSSPAGFWECTVTALPTGSLGNEISVSVGVVTGTVPPTVEVRDEQVFTTSTGLWTAAANRVGIKVSGDATVAAVEAAIDASSSLLYVSSPHPTPSSTINTAGFGTSTPTIAWTTGGVGTEPGTVYGGGGDPTYQFRIRTRRQRCQSFRLRISERPVSNAGGASFSLQEVALTVGVRPGEHDPPTRRTRS